MAYSRTFFLRTAAAANLQKLRGRPTNVVSLPVGNFDLFDKIFENSYLEAVDEELLFSSRGRGGGFFFFFFRCPAVIEFVSKLFAQLILFIVIFRELDL